MADPPEPPLAAVRAAEAAIRPLLADRLRRAVDEGDVRAGELRRWAEEDGSAVRRAAAREACVLTNHVRYRVATGARPPPELQGTPVGAFEGLARPVEVDAEIDRLEARLGGWDDVDAGLLGADYAHALAEAERRERGQFYTPSAVAALAVRWAVAGVGPRPRVLDPAAGTGRFQLAVLDAGEGARAGRGVGPGRPALVGVDVDAVALHVAGLRLAAETGDSRLDWFDRRPRSFFELEPGRDLAPVDAVVGNPPFVRAGELAPGRDHFRDHLDSFGDGDATPYADGDRALSGRCDASVYFVTHATRFLRPGGRLGMVLPAKWLESDYGVGFRQFLADHYDVHAIVGFGARAFDALVDTVVLLAERRGAGDGADSGGSVRFLRLDEQPRIGPSLDRLRRGRVAAAGGEAEPGRLVRCSQSTFAAARQCSPYLRAPEPLLDLLDHPDLVPLGELASVRRGVTTGANRFFLLDAEDRDRWDVDPGLLRPALRSVRGFDARTLTDDDVELAVVDVHGALAGSGERGAGDPTTATKAALRAAGHECFLAYVDHAEERGWHEGRTCQTRPVWFDLGPLPTPDAFVPKLVRERVFTVRNRAGAVPSNAIDCLDVREGVEPALLLGVLDSTLCRALMEVWGRDEAGLLQLMTSETRSLPVPDVRAFDPEGARAVVEAAEGLAVEGPEGPARGQGRLDEAVLAQLEVGIGAGRLRELRESLVARRVEGGDRVAVPID